MQQRPFTFITNKGYRHNLDRGGQMYTIQAYLEEFTDKDNVLLLIKINPAYGVADMNNLILQLAPKKDNLPKIAIDINGYEYKGLVELYNKADVFVCATKAEAFNLPGLEAKACGLMTIQTGFGGQIDYMKEGTDLFIDYDLEEVKWEIQYEGTLWAKPKIESLRKHLRWCYENQEEVKKRGEQAVKEAKEFTWDKSAQLICSLI